MVKMIKLVVNPEYINYLETLTDQDCPTVTKALDRLIMQHQQQRIKDNEK